MVTDPRFLIAVQAFWQSRTAQQQRQLTAGKADAGLRGAVTGGGQMAAIESLIRELLVDAGVPPADIITHSRLEIPGYFRGEKKWDLLVISRRRLVLAIEFKSQVGPSFGNNFNNRTEEAIGSATDVWTAYREGRFGAGPAPFLGYFFLLEDCPAVRRPVRWSEPHFPVEPTFRDASYEHRYHLLCRRLVLERLYNAACLTLATAATAATPTEVRHSSPDLAFATFASAVVAHARTSLALPDPAEGRS